MIFRETEVGGAYVIEPELLRDERGFFARTWCQREFDERGLDTRLVQCSISHNAKKGTLRGLHYQTPPSAETKLVRCTRGTIYDVVLDLRRESPTFLRWVAEELSAENRKMMYVPQGCAHGFLTLEEKTEIFYQMSDFYAPHYARGVRWNDPAFAVDWPAEVLVIAPRDATYPDFAT